MNINKTVGTKMEIGTKITCLYPQHGNEKIGSIMIEQAGKIVKIVKNPKCSGNAVVTIEREDGTFRSLTILKMVNVVIDGKVATDLDSLYAQFFEGVMDDDYPEAESKLVEYLMDECCMTYEKSVEVMQAMFNR